MAARASKKRRPGKTGQGYAVQRNILRADYARTRGFIVRIYRTERGKKQLTAKFFADSRYGSRAAAYLAALEWRDAQLKRLRSPIKGGASRTEIGHSYVKKRLYKTPDGKSYMAWHGFIKTGARSHRLTKWSVPKWGDVEAKRRCHAWLARQQKELEARLKLERSAQRKKVVKATSVAKAKKKSTRVTKAKKSPRKGTKRK